MKDNKKILYNFTYAIQLFINLIFITGLSLWIHILADGQLFVVYICNALFITWILIEEKLYNTFYEKMYYKLKNGSWAKQRFKEMLVGVARKPSMKVVLYVHYLICILAERLFYFGVAENVTGIAGFKEYLSIMYYSFILLMALDKVKEVMTKDDNYRKKYYAKFDE